MLIFSEKKMILVQKNVGKCFNLFKNIWKQKKSLQYKKLCDLTLAFIEIVIKNDEGLSNPQSKKNEKIGHFHKLWEKNIFPLHKVFHFLTQKFVEMPFP